jgi:hypothetical protein
MKKITLTVLVVGLNITTVFSQIPSYIPSNGLIGWWPFNGNANNEAGNGLDGTIYGSTLTSDRFGVSNKAYSFDGIDDYIDFGDSSIIDFGNSDFTVCFWVNRQTSNGPFDYDNSFAFGKWDHGDATLGENEFGTAISYDDSSGFNKFQFATNIGTNPISVCRSNDTVSLNNWYFLLAQRNGDSITTFVNGIIQNTIFIGSGVLNNAGRTLLMGTYYPFNPLHQTPWNFTNALFDDAAIWNRALTQQEITDLFNSGTSGISTLTGEPKKLVKILDINGREIERCKNTLMLFQYSDGSIEKVYEMEY